MRMAATLFVRHPFSFSLPTPLSGSLEPVSKPFEALLFKRTIKHQVQSDHSRS